MNRKVSENSVLDCRWHYHAGVYCYWKFSLQRQHSSSRFWGKSTQIKQFATSDQIAHFQLCGKTTKEYDGVFVEAMGSWKVNTKNNEVWRLSRRWGTVFKLRKNKSKREPWVDFEAWRWGTQLQQSTACAGLWRPTVLNNTGRRCCPYCKRLISMMMKADKPFPSPLLRSGGPWVVQSWWGK